MCIKGLVPCRYTTWGLFKFYMKKNLSFVAICLCVFASCINGHGNSTAKVNDTCHIERYFHSFMSRFPDGLDNEIKRNKMNEQFVLEITDSLKNSEWLLEDYPLRFAGLREYKDSICRVQFQSWLQPSNFKFKDFNFREFGFDIVAEVPKQVAINLKDENYYIVHGRLNRYISHEEFKLYASKMAYTSNVGIEEEIGIKGAVNWNLGEMLFDIDSISVYNK